MPVKVADRYDTGCADANQTGSLDIFFNYTGIVTIKSIFIVAKISNWRITVIYY